jgi:hypothetical protein
MLDANVKWIMSIAVLAIVVCLWLFVSPQAKDSGAGWRFGKNDPVRLIFFTEGGSLRPGAKFGVTVLCVIFMLIVWLL